MKQHAGAGKIILLVEDNADIRVIFAMCLEEGGYKVVEASDGAAAVLLLSDLKPHAVITDLLMPNMGGIELARFMKTSAGLSDIPVGLVTATPPSRALANAEHFSRILIKPCSVEELLDLANYLVSIKVPLLRYK